MEVDLLCRKCTTGSICQYEDVKNREEVSVPFGSSTPMSDAVGTVTGRSERARGDATVNLQSLKCGLGTRRCSVLTFNYNRILYTLLCNTFTSASRSRDRTSTSIDKRRPRARHTFVHNVCTLDWDFTRQHSSAVTRILCPWPPKRPSTSTRRACCPKNARVVSSPL